MQKNTNCPKAASESSATLFGIGDLRSEQCVFGFNNAVLKVPCHWIGGTKGTWLLFEPVGFHKIIDNTAMLYHVAWQSYAYHLA